LINRLTRGLGKRPFFECPICYNSITPSQQIWCCLPPDGPPPSPFAPGIDVIDPKIVSAHYQACYTPFHYTCVRDWSRRNYEEDQTRLSMIDSSDEAVWRCPGCQKRRAESIPPYR
jgi:transcriptional repressor NF-X1